MRTTVISDAKNSGKRPVICIKQSMAVLLRTEHCHFYCNKSLLNEMILP